MSGAGLMEVKREADAKAVTQSILDAIKRVFEVRAAVDVIPNGTLAADFETSMKAPRFMDLRV